MLEEVKIEGDDAAHHSKRLDGKVKSGTVQFLA
jgi:hypothetical protein